MATTRSQSAAGTLLVPMGDPVAIERAASAARRALAQEMARPYRRIPTEIWERTLNYLSSPWDLPTNHPNYIRPQELSNVRLTNSFFRSGAETTFLRRNFRHLHVKLDAKFPGIGITPGDVDKMAAILSDPYYSNRGTGLPGGIPNVDICDLVRTIRFTESALSPTGNGIDMVHMMNWITTLLNSCTRLVGIEICPPVTQGASTNALMVILSQQPAIAQRITIDQGSYIPVQIVNVFTNYDGVMESLIMRHVAFPGANLDFLTTTLRNSQALREVSLERITTAAPAALQNVCYMSTAPGTAAVTRACRVNLTIPPYSAPGTVLGPELTRIQMYTISPIGQATAMYGPYGCQMGINHILQMRGSANYDPNLSIEQRRATGELL